MNFIDNFYVFPQAVKLSGQLKCDIYDQHYLVSFNDEECPVDLLLIRPESTWMLLFDDHKQCFLPVENWETIVSSAQVTTTQALNLLQTCCFMQIDYYHGVHFVKVFLPQNQLILQSNTHDFSLYSHFPVDYIHPLDWQYQINAQVLSAATNGQVLNITFNVLPSVLSETAMYATYGEDSVELAVGFNELKFPYRKGKRLCFGNKPYYHGLGNSVDVEKYL